MISGDRNRKSMAEAKDADAEIRWTVRLVNAKAAHPSRGMGYLTGSDLIVMSGAASGRSLPARDTA
jgi:hypothetical protein